jgi:chemotaxis protein MotB
LPKKPQSSNTPAKSLPPGFVPKSGIAPAGPAAPIPEAPVYQAPQPKRHGGAWKVAYADFVTALMALFIVMWMMSSSDKVKQSVSGYFHDPRGYTQSLGTGPANSGEGLAVSHDNIGQMRDQIEQALRKMPEFEKFQGNVKMSVTGEGLRIDLLENEQGLFFVTGSPHPTEAGERLLESLAAEISQMPNPIVIEGHTDARPFRNAAPATGYGNWDLSADRANAARRLLHAYGVPSEQVVEVRGFAERKLMNPDDPNDARNRRVSLVLQFSH